jgi:hypothetical protein
VIKESEIMKDIHRIRGEFYRKTRAKSHEYVLKMIKEESLKVKQELEKTKPDVRLIVQKKYLIPEPISMKEIHQVREKDTEYGERKAVRDWNKRRR